MFASDLPIVKSSWSRRRASVIAASAMILPTTLSGVIDMNRRWAQWLDGCLAKTESIRIARGKGWRSAASVASRMKRIVRRTKGQSAVK
jgi:hypothetical protein